jgi:hypothetical protein
MWTLAFATTRTAHADMIFLLHAVATSQEEQAVKSKATTMKRGEPSCGPRDISTAN